MGVSFILVRRGAEDWTSPISSMDRNPGYIGLGASLEGDGKTADLLLTVVSIGKLGIGLFDFGVGGASVEDGEGSRSGSAVVSSDGGAMVDDMVMVTRRLMERGVRSMQTGTRIEDIKRCFEGAVN